MKSIIYILFILNTVVYAQFKINYNRINYRNRIDERKIMLKDECKFKIILSGNKKPIESNNIINVCDKIFTFKLGNQVSFYYNMFIIKLYRQ